MSPQFQRLAIASVICGFSLIAQAIDFPVPVSGMALRIATALSRNTPKANFEQLSEDLSKDLSGPVDVTLKQAIAPLKTLQERAIANQY